MSDNGINDPNSTILTKKLKANPSECKICSEPAFYKHFGVIVCHPCKTFFGRNAPLGLEAFKCDLDGNCQININTRHVCKACRLSKCLASGMKVERIGIKKSNQFQLIPVRNLLRTDQSNLTIEEWHLISNIIHCYEECSAVPYVENFLQEQTKLPIKLRYKTTSISQLFGTILSYVELFFKSNQNFLSLSTHDRSILLRSAMENTGSFASVLVLRQTNLFDYSDIEQSVENLYGKIALNLSKRLLDDVDRDITFVKLGIAIFAFSTMNCTIYTNNRLDYLENVKEILNIQNMYIDIAWKYLIYKYGHRQAVKCFMNFIRCLFFVNTTLIQSHQTQHHKQMVENLIEKIDQQVTLNH